MKAKRKEKQIRFMLVLAVFLLGLLVVWQTVRTVRRSDLEKAVAKAQLNAVTYGGQMIDQLRGGVAITESLEQILISSNGELNNFEKVAANQMQPSIQSIRLAPNGIVTQVYPEKGNENARMDLFSGGLQTQVCRYAQEQDTVTFQGPFTLSQGGRGIAIRNPVFLEQKDGSRRFWGFTIAIIRVPDIFESTIDALQGFGYYYRLSMTTQPIQTEFKAIDSSGVALTDAVSYTMELGNCSWKLEVAPMGGWDNDSRTQQIALAGLAIVLLLTGLVAAMLVLNDGRRRFRHMAATDALTGLLNRNGFDRALEAYYREHPGEDCVAGLLDIDDFKLVNDVYGHATGDLVLRQLAEDLRQTFPEDAILGRNGGDEFSFLLKNVTEEAVRERIQRFAAKDRQFISQGALHGFGISLGYAGGSAVPAETSLLSKADMALYAVKLQGKHSAQAYTDHIERSRRVQLGFALHDLSENLPGAFLIYKANPKDDTLLYASQELIDLVGCQDFRDFMRFTGGHFGSLIHPEDRQTVEESIWAQINSGSDGNNGYVAFRCAVSDGSYRNVLDHGRIVDNPHYGKLFYVLFIDRAFLKRYT